MTEKVYEHPLESVFNIEPGSAPLSSLAEVNDDGDDDYSAVPAEMVTQQYKDDEEDVDINNKIEDIYNTALEAYNNQASLAEIVEPRYAARNAEVAAQYLNIALNATSLKSRNKSDKRKQQSFIPFNNTNINNSNVVVASRNDILRMMAEKKREQEAREHES